MLITVSNIIFFKPKELNAKLKKSIYFIFNKNNFYFTRITRNRRTNINFNDKSLFLCHYSRTSYNRYVTLE